MDVIAAIKPEDGLQVGLMTYADVPQYEFLLNSNNSTRQALLAMSSSQFFAGTNRATFSALDFARSEMICSCNGARNVSSKVVIFFTYGQSTNSEATSLVASQLHGDGAYVIAIGMGSKNYSEIQSIASQHNFAISFQKFHEFQNLVTTLVNIVCEIRQNSSFPQSNTSTFETPSELISTTISTFSQSNAGPQPVFTPTSSMFIMQTQLSTADEVIFSSPLSEMNSLSGQPFTNSITEIYPTKTSSILNSYSLHSQMTINTASLDTKNSFLSDTSISQSSKTSVIDPTPHTPMSTLIESDSSTLYSRRSRSNILSKSRQPGNSMMSTIEYTSLAMSYSSVVSNFEKTKVTASSISITKNIVAMPTSTVTSTTSSSAAVKTGEYFCK